MSDVEWYIVSESNPQAKQGPYSAKQITSLYQEGKVVAQSKVTTARMGSDWVSVSDLVQAYRDMYQQQKEKEKSVLGVGGKFAAPPRPTEQLEASRLITLNPKGALGDAPDATESLFQAIQAVREKSAQKQSQMTQAQQLQREERLGQLAREQPKFPPQVPLIVVLVVVAGIGLWGSLKILDRLKAEKKPDASQVTVAEPVAKPASTTPIKKTGGSLLSTGGGGATRSASPTRYNPPPEPTGGAVRLENGDPGNSEITTMPAEVHPESMNNPNDANANSEDSPNETVPKDELQNALDNARSNPNAVPQPGMPIMPPSPDYNVAPAEPSP